MIRHQQNLDGVTPHHLVGFWEAWPTPPTPEAHIRVLRGSEAIVLAMDTSQRDRVVGFITAVGDGVLASYIPFLEVLPDYRGRGIGSALVEQMLTQLAGRYMVDLVCDDDLVPFYERFGLTRYNAMIRRQRDVLEPAPDRTGRLGADGASGP